MSDLTDFLLARIAEDEAAARYLLRDLEGQIAEGGFGADERGPFTPTRQLAAEMWAFYAGQTRWRNFARGQHIARFSDPSRVLAECEAKRRIVEAHPLTSDAVGTGCRTCDLDEDGMLVMADGGCTTLRALAFPYADHLDFREEWRV